MRAATTFYVVVASLLAACAQGPVDACNVTVGPAHVVGGTRCPVNEAMVGVVDTRLLECGAVVVTCPKPD